jgi:hypothetical protein
MHIALSQFLRILALRFLCAQIRPFPSGSVKFAGDLYRIVSHFHPAIPATAWDIPAATKLKRLTVLREIVIGNAVPERGLWNSRE